MNKVLVVAAHADDEALGCGGTIAKHARAGDRVSVLFMTNGVSARVEEFDSTKVSARAEAASKAAKVLGVYNIIQLDFPDNQMDSIALLDVVQAIEKHVKAIAPNIIYTHFGFDLNCDHRITHQAVMTACRPQKNCSVKEIYCFEVLSSTEWQSKLAPQFLPDLIVDISDTWEAKLKALSCYEDELRPFPHSRSTETVAALATYRGATHGITRAEAFFIERQIR